LGETVVKQAFRLKPTENRQVADDSQLADGRQLENDYQIESGELALTDRSGKVLPLSIFVRLKR
jgi:hypothetical protein